MNLAAALSEDQWRIEIAGINTLGVLYILENGNRPNHLRSSRKNTYASGQGATRNIHFGIFLKQNGIDPEKDVTIEYVAQHAELATMMVQTKWQRLASEPNVVCGISRNK